MAAKTTIFKNPGHIDTGVEVVPMKDLAEQMSTGVSYFEQFVWDLEQRGVSNIDIPVLPCRGRVGRGCGKRPSTA